MPSFRIIVFLLCGLVPLGGKGGEVPDLGFYTYFIIYCKKKQLQNGYNFQLKLFYFFTGKKSREISQILHIKQNKGCLILILIESVHK